MNPNMVKAVGWSGRVDGKDPDNLRWHQIVSHVLLPDLHRYSDQWCIIGYPGDTGVERNQGRVGAAKGPEAIRNSASLLPVPKPGFVIPDLGNYLPTDNLEKDQEYLAHALAQIHQSNNRSLLLGGGHEITYPHFKGLKKAHPDKRIGILNIDAHYDLREVNPSVGPTSGTGFYQILTEYPDTGYMILGVNEASNTQVLAKRADTYGVRQLNLFDFQILPAQEVIYHVRLFAQNYDLLYLTVCMDAFSAAFAPGVSAPSSFGLIPDARFFSIFRQLQRLNKIHAFDIAELNPQFDIDSRTARLAAQLLYYWLTE